MSHDPLTLWIIVAVVEPGKGTSSNIIMVYWFISIALCPFNNANAFSLNGMVKHLLAPTRMTFMSVNKTKMFYLYVSLQTSLHSLKDVSDSAPSLCQKLSSQAPSVLCHSFISAVGLYMAVFVTVGPDTDSDCLFVWLLWPVYLVSAIKLLNEVCLKTNRVLSDEKKKKKKLLYTINCIRFWRWGGTKDVLILDSV